MNNEIFSVIIPFYNAADTIDRALSSLISNKKYIKEIILVNDRSTDNWEEIIEPFKNFFKNKIRIINNTGNQGPGPSRRAGLIAATADWICFLDSDDAYSLSCFHYVYDFIKENSDIYLILSKTIYRQDGKLNPNLINFSNLSCGGNFYNRQFLIDNKLFPHKSLFLAEDEYFNDVIIKYITLVKKEDKKIFCFASPTYEVHQELDQRLSFSFSNNKWCDYLVKYHLLYKQYVVDFLFNKVDSLDLINDVISNFIFCYFLANGLVNDEQYEYATWDYFLPMFKNYYKMLKEKFFLNRKTLISWKNTYAASVVETQHNAELSLGYSIIFSKNFENFLNYIEKEYET